MLLSLKFQKIYVITLALESASVF